jgi:hypothetical protein
MSTFSLALRACASLAVLATVGCASADYHYSQIDGRRYYRTPIDTYPVSITQIDGKTEVFRPALVEPGTRQVTVQAPPGAAASFGQTRTIALQVAPCTRYYLVAVKSSPLANDFTVRVDYEEPVSGCTPPRS